MNIIEQLIPQAEGNQEIIDFINTQIAARIKKGKNVPLGEAEHILDYLKSPQAPKKLRKASYKDMKRKSEEWLESLKKKGQGVIETEKDVKIIKTYENGYRFVRLKSKNAFEREGNLMGHCVASYHNKKGVSIYSLRDSTNVPHCTIEVVEEGGQIQQIKGKGNGPIHPRYIEFVLDICKQVGKEIRESEFRYLGYTKLPEEFWTIIDRTMKGVKHMTYGGNRYLYTHGKRKLKVSREEAEKIAQEILGLEA